MKKLLFAFLFSMIQLAFSKQAPIIESSFIFEDAPFKSCHASTLLQTKNGLLVAWFAGSEEGANDVKIWSSTYKNKTWSRPAVIAEGTKKSGVPLPTWNPVLYKSSTGQITLFYKEGLSPKSWKGMMTNSFDEGNSWTKPVELPQQMIGPTKNRPLSLSNGNILYPSSTEGDDYWQVHIETSDHQMKNWTKSNPINNKDIFVIQPTLLQLNENKILMLMRNSRVKHIMASWSNDIGKSWSAPKPISLPNPSSAIDAVVMTNGKMALVYNHSIADRGTMDLALSSDHGKTWSHRLNLEKDIGAEFSYPSIIQTSDGLLRLTYTWRRHRIKYLVIDLKLL